MEGPFDQRRQAGRAGSAADAAGGVTAGAGGC